MNNPNDNNAIRNSVKTNTKHNDNDPSVNVRSRSEITPNKTQWKFTLCSCVNMKNHDKIAEVKLSRQAISFLKLTNLGEVGKYKIRIIVLILNLEMCLNFANAGYI